MISAGGGGGGGGGHAYFVKYNMFLKIGKVKDLPLNIQEIYNLSLENEKIDNRSFINSHFKCQEKAVNAFTSV